VSLCEALCLLYLMQETIQTSSSFQMQHQASLKDEPGLDQGFTTARFGERVDTAFLQTLLKYMYFLSKCSSVIAYLSRSLKREATPRV
jgi:hypothetical protein